MATYALRATTEQLMSLKTGSYNDPSVSGLFLYVQPRKRAWKWRGWVNGKQIKMTLGDFPSLGLADAREKASDIIDKKERGEDPTVEKKKQAEESVEHVFSKWEEWSRMVGKGQKSAREKRRIFERDVFPFIGQKLLVSVVDSDIEHLLQRFVDEDKRYGYNQVLIYLNGFYSWAQRKRYTNYNPALHLDKLVVEVDNHCPSLRELALLWIEAGKETDIDARDSMRMLILTGARRNEVVCMSSSEIRDDNWIIPRGRAKSGRECQLPLSPIVKSIVNQRLNREYVFHDKPRYDSHRKAFRRMMDRLVKKTGQHFRFHDIRHGFRTGLVEYEICDETIAERIINHATAGIHRRYDHSKYRKPKLTALEAWETLLMAEVDKINGDNVIAMCG